MGWHPPSSLAAGWRRFGYRLTPALLWIFVFVDDSMAADKSYRPQRLLRSGLVFYFGRLPHLLVQRCVGRSGGHFQAHGLAAGR